MLIFLILIHLLTKCHIYLQWKPNAKYYNSTFSLRWCQQAICKHSTRFTIIFPVWQRIYVRWFISHYTLLCIICGLIITHLQNLAGISIILNKVKHPSIALCPVFSILDFSQRQLKSCKVSPSYPHLVLPRKNNQPLCLVGRFISLIENKKIAITAYVSTTAPIIVMVSLKSNTSVYVSVYATIIFYLLHFLWIHF